MPVDLARPRPLRSRAETKRFRTDIQGMRALAVLAVVLYHAGVPFLPGGYVGVDIFFVISGFLITGLLLREIERSGRVSFKDFYARRIRRLLPASALVLLATVVGAKLLVPPLLLPDMAKDAVATSLFFANMRFAQTGTDYLAGTSPSPFQHYWSLALEEQFYLVWPLIMVLVAAFAAAHRRKWLAGVLVVLSVLSLLGGVVLTGISQPWAFFSLPTRAWELGLGGLVALAAPLLVRMGGKLARAVGLLGLILVGASIVVFTHDLPFPGWFALIPVLGAALMIGGGQIHELRVLQAPVLQYVGNISYSLYLWHWPLLTLAKIRLGENFNGWIALGLVALSLGLADLTYRHVEQRFQHSPALKVRAARSYALGAGLTVVALAISFSVTQLPDLDAGETVAAPDARQLMEAPATPGFVPSNLTPALEGAAGSTPSVYADGCHGAYETTKSADCTYGDETGAGALVLFGDSHAAQWFTPMDKVAQNEGRKLVSLTKSSCPSVDIPVQGKVSETYPQCDEWRQDSLERIKALEPDLVVLSNYGSVYRELGRDLEDFEQEWREGLERTVRALPAGTDVVVLGDTPGWEIAPSVCLSTNLQDVDECTAPKDQVIDAEVANIEREAMRAAGGRYVSPVDWICQGTCSPIAWNLLVYRDTHHLTNEMAGALTGRLQQALELPAP